MTLGLQQQSLQGARCPQIQGRCRGHRARSAPRFLHALSHQGAASSPDPSNDDGPSTSGREHAPWPSWPWQGAWPGAPRQPQPAPPGFQRPASMLACAVGSGSSGGSGGWGSNGGGGGGGWGGDGSLPGSGGIQPSNVLADIAVSDTPELVEEVILLDIGGECRSNEHLQARHSLRQKDTVQYTS